jgi:hypothetical protein
VAHQQEYLQGSVCTDGLSHPAVVTYNFTEAGVEKKVELDNLSSSDVAAKIAQLLNIA